MLLTRESDYAIVSLLTVAAEGRLPVSEIARRHDLSPSFLGNIVASLARAGLVLTWRGAAGGLSLARSPSEITLLEIIEAVQGRLCLNTCLDCSQQCPRRAECPASPVFAHAQAVLRKSLEVTLTEVLDHRTVPRPESVLGGDPR